MSKNIQTHNAKLDLIKKFLDYAHIADASYALIFSFVCIIFVVNISQ